ncbi:MAG: glycine--tRNA ligase subunit beta [Gammaproteobacteria bacterium]
MADTKPFLVEIGTEELPPKVLRHLAQHFYEGVWKALSMHRFIPNTYPQERGEFFFSPRRLTVYIPHVLTKQPVMDVQLVAGPSLNIAFDKNNRPTAAAKGFARKFNASVSALIQKDGKLFFKPKPQRMNADLYLPSAVKASLEKLPIDNRMRWGTSQVEFIRPVHWVVMLLGERPLKSEILGVTAGNKTYGHRFHHPAAIVIKRPEDYRKTLATIGKVMVEDRHGSLKAKIKALVTQAAAKVYGHAQLDEALLEEVTSLVEWPVPITGGFDDKFLALPDEVIVAVLETQQRYFPLRHRNGKLMPYFVTLANIKSKMPGEIRRGNERVIVPRLTDAKFFWDSDRKTMLASRIPELDRVVFQKELGTYGDKSRRIAKLAVEIANQIVSNTQLMERAAQLAKCDLVTAMVNEFPELQGSMGGYYARHDGEPDEVCAAIGEQYRPRFAGDQLPRTRTGQALAIADKLDTIVGIFAIGQKPTGDKDPFGLRRAGLGLMRIAIECSLEIDLRRLIALAQEQLPLLPDEHKFEVAVYNFLTDRLRAYYQEIGVRNDVFEAVDLENPATPVEFHRHLLAVQDFLALPEARNLAAANKRIQNILAQAGLTQYPHKQDFLSLDEALFENDAEHALHAALESVERDIAPFYEQHRYSEALCRLAGLRAPVDQFFEQVMVMADDERLRNNRLALLQRVHESFLRIADIGQLQV